MPKVYLSEKANRDLVEYLRATGYTIHFVNGEGSSIQSAIKYHPDIFFCDLGDMLYQGDPQQLQEPYPGDVLYNCARVGQYLICSKHTSPDLLDKAKKLGLKLIEVSQGYVKCNVVVVSDRAIITEDEGIAKAVSAKAPDLKVLLIKKGGVLLPPYNHGFIGGATGRVHGEIIFNGDIKSHPDFTKIDEFIKAEGAKYRYFDYPLEDIGSIIEDPLV